MAAMSRANCEHQAVYRIDTDGTVIEVTHDVELPNGIVLSPDERTLYVGDHNNGGNRLTPDGPPSQARARCGSTPFPWVTTAC